ncbi:MAG: hypothetical protein WD749_03520 [Phycisphaerales bacterium]
MMKPRRSLTVLAAALAIGGATLVGTAHAGPPGVCFPYDNGGAKSLPWGSDRMGTDRSYDTTGLVKDTLDLLKTERSTLARMETLRRAALYAQSKPQLAGDLLARLSWIAMDMEAAGKPSAEAWFAPGFFAVLIEQTGTTIGWKPGVADGVQGYAWIKKALSIEPGNTEMQYAAALATCDTEHRERHREHMRAALTGASEGSALARSMEQNHAIGAKPVAELRKSFGVADAGGR